MHTKKNPWYNFIQKYGLPNIMWSEKIRDSYLSTPVNTISNIFYIIGGLYILQDTNLKLKLYGFNLIFLGIMSGLYHASVSLPFQICDFLGMQFLISTIIGIHLKYSIINILKLKLLFILVLISFIYFKIPLQIITIISTLIVIKTAPIYNQDFYIVIFLLFVAEVFSILDLKKYFKNTKSIIQGHALWHFISSISLYYWYVYIKKLI